MIVVAAPNAFKDSLSAAEICRCIERAAALVSRGIRVVSRPMADGGDGTAEVLKAALKASWRSVQVLDPLGRKMRARYLWCEGESLAVVEMARASGLALLAPGERNPLRTSTYGTGQLIRAAAAAGAQRIIIAIGGSATVDGGAGCMQALGVHFLDSRDRLMPEPITGGMLPRVCAMRPGSIRDRIPRSCRMEVACDVSNPLLGRLGSARVFGPQKGANSAAVEHLEAGLGTLARAAAECFGQKLARITKARGAGAAGGLAAGLMVSCKARLVPGARLVAELIGLETAVEHADLVISGEGAIDEQTVMGKAPAEVVRIARRCGVPAALLGGSVSAPWRLLRRAGVAGAFTIVPGPVALEEALAKAPQLVTAAAANLLAFYSSERPHPGREIRLSRSRLL